MELLRNTDFYKWGTDDLKIDVSQGKVDIALVYSGDFFDSYYADLEAEEEGSEEYYEFVEDDEVLDSLSKVFEELLEDVEII